MNRYDSSKSLIGTHNQLRPETRKSEDIEKVKDEMTQQLKIWRNICPKQSMKSLDTEIFSWLHQNTTKLDLKLKRRPG
jgi:hypothetical protein